MPHRYQPWIAPLVSLAILLSITGSAVSLPRPSEIDQVQIYPVPLRGVEPPSKDATAEALKQRADALRAEVASTVSDPADADDELRYLYRILTS